MQAAEYESPVLEEGVTFVVVQKNFFSTKTFTLSASKDNGVILQAFNDRQSVHTQLTWPWLRSVQASQSDNTEFKISYSLSSESTKRKPVDLRDSDVHSLGISQAQR